MSKDKPSRTTPLVMGSAVAATAFIALMPPAQRLAKYSFIYALRSWRKHVAPKSFGASEIVPGLYLGNMADAHNVGQLEEHGISHVLSILAGCLPSHPENFTYLYIDAYDNPQQDLMQHLPEAIEFIHAALSAKTGVLVHCMKGRSRSSTLVIAYLMARHEPRLSLEDALLLCQKARVIDPPVQPNPAFMHQLRLLEWYLKHDVPPENWGGPVTQLQEQISTAEVEARVRGEYSKEILQLKFELAEEKAARQEVERSRSELEEKQSESSNSSAPPEAPAVHSTKDVSVQPAPLAAGPSTGQTLPPPPAAPPLSLGDAALLPPSSSPPPSDGTPLPLGGGGSGAEPLSLGGAPSTDTPALSLGPKPGMGPLMSQLRSGTQLKPTRPSSSRKEGGMGGLLDSIRQGSKLRSVKADGSRARKPSGQGLDMAAAIRNRQPLRSTGGPAKSKPEPKEEDLPNFALQARSRLKKTASKHRIAEE